MTRFPWIKVEPRASRMNLVLCPQNVFLLPVCQLFLGPRVHCIFLAQQYKVLEVDDSWDEAPILSSGPGWGNNCVDGCTLGYQVCPKGASN